MLAPLTTSQLVDALRRRDSASATELAETLGKSQPSISRAIARAGNQVASWGQARRRRYAATRNVRGLGIRWPLYRMDASGHPQLFAHLTALHGSSSLVHTREPVDWLRGAFVDGLFPGLPWFLDDMRPQGYLGRQFAHTFSHQLGLPEDILAWDTDAVLTALLLQGHDASGNFILGDQALQRALAEPRVTIAEPDRSRRYAALAQATTEGELVGSSAAGEQPKFTTCVTNSHNVFRHVIVKFTEPYDANPIARRWADLLICEHIATQVLARHDHHSAPTELVHAQGRLCLESTRFDRIGPHGRRGIVTLAAWSDAHDGVRDNWAAAARRMHQTGWITRETMEQVCLRWWFGRLIGNTDMHFGNLAFYLDDALPLQLAPSYDMLPMYYRPSISGAMQQQPLTPPAPIPIEYEAWRAASDMACEFWEMVASRQKTGPGIRPLARKNLDALIVAKQRFG